jgi:hypothetical protein
MANQLDGRAFVDPRQLVRGAGRLLAGLLLLTAGACLPDFAPASQLGAEPRVLTIQATPPEAPAGATVTLEALVHQPDGGTPGLHWLRCLLAAGDTPDTCVANRWSGTDALVDCAAAPAAALCRIGQGSPVTVTVPSLLAGPGGEDTPFVVELVFTPGGEGLAACEAAVATITPTDACQLAVKRVGVDADGSANVNPAIAALTVDGEPVDATAVVDLAAAGGDDAEIDLGVELDPASVDDFDPDADPEDPVWLAVAWYTTCGELTPDASGEGWLRCEPRPDRLAAAYCDPLTVGWKPGTAGACTVVVLVRDAAGGVAFREQRFAR